MSSIAIVYFSGTGSTAQLAEAAARGARSVPGTSAHLLPISSQHIHEGKWSDPATLATLATADAIVFATPTYMGGPAAQFKAFADATSTIWYSQNWKDKLAGGMTVSGALGGDKLSTLAYLSIFAAQHGMHWVNLGQLPRQPDGTNRIGSFLGVQGQNIGTSHDKGELDATDAHTAMLYGQRIAVLAARLAKVTARTEAEAL